MKGIIDRIENKYAVIELENKDFIDIKISDLPLGIKEGDCIVIKENKIFLDLGEKYTREKNINKLMENLFEK